MKKKWIWGIGITVCLGLAAAGWMHGEAPSDWEAGKDDHKILAYIGEELGLELTPEMGRSLVFGADPVSFHGDGTAYGKLLLTEAGCEAAVRRVEKSLVRDGEKSQWHKGAAVGIAGSMRRVTYLNENYEIPKIEQGYYFFKNRNDNTAFAAELGHSPNFTAGLLDTEKRVLYYGSFDQ